MNHRPRKEYAMREKRLLLTAILLIISCFLCAKPITVTASTPITIKPSDAPPIIDGKLNDPAWNTSTAISKFTTMSPDFGMDPSENTRVSITYDKTHLYFAIRSFDREAGHIKASVTKRDNLGTDDWISIELDTFNDAQPNYLFKVNPLGIQADGMINRNDEDDLSLDMVWNSKGNVDEKGYVVEVAIPFKNLRLPDKKQIVMGIGIRRSIGRKSEIVTFPAYNPNNGSRLTQRQSIMISGIQYKRTIEVIPVTTFSGSDNRFREPMAAGRTGKRFRCHRKSGHHPYPDTGCNL